MKQIATVITFCLTLLIQLSAQSPARVFTSNTDVDRWMKELSNWGRWAKTIISGPSI
jgi:hypothetical protein